MKMHYSICFVGFLLVSFMGVQAQAENEDLSLESLKTEILTAFGDEAGKASAVVAGNELKVGYRTRRFLVHNGSKTGEWSEKAREVVGPSSRGITIRIFIQAASLPSAWRRPVNDSGATVGFKGRAPYWQTLTWVMPLEGKEQNVWINLAHGGQTDSEVLEKLKVLFGQIR
ncbi:MAG: hypothetical protein RRC34_07450 [Lentisphaeria bacterium]|nr:hypothetical protein [Lentisphaeria bacterium]